MAEIVFYPEVYTADVSYKNFKGEEKKTTLNFYLDPINLMQLIIGYVPKKIKSGNPAINGKDAEIADEDQVKMIRKLASQAAGIPSDDGEQWLPWPDFEESVAGKAFITKLVSSDSLRREFSEKAVVGPFRTFVNFAANDPTNSPQEIKELQLSLSKVENIFKVPEPGSETAEERRARLERELASMTDSATSE